MEHLWAPWRNQYVSETKSVSPRIFWEIGQSQEDEKNFVIHRAKTCFCILNIFPYNTGHTMVIPYREVTSLDELSSDEMLELMQQVTLVTNTLKACFKPHGFNIGINIGQPAGAGIPQHLHVHIVPRWTGDANFMTTTANARVHPSDLKTIWEKMREEISRSA